jgi:gliding motility-associated-like protein
VLIVKNTWGCADTIIKNITVNSDFKLFVPNSFTPNGDGVNDTFQPKGRGVAKYSLWVYNRWGNIIFKTEDFEKGWDGLVSGSSSSDDVFTWRITTVDVLGKSKEFTGYVTLSR